MHTFAAKIGTLVLLLFVFFSTPVRADIFDDYGEATNSLDFQAEVGIFSRRLFREQDLYDGTSIQPRLRAQANIETVSVYLEGFSHLNTGPSGGTNQSDFSELDYDLGAFAALDFMTLHFGHRWYSYTKKTERLDNTGEFFGKVQLDTIAHPHLELDYDWDSYKGWYGEVGAEAPVPLELGQTDSSLIPFATVSFSSGLADGKMPIYAEDGFVGMDFGVRGQFYLIKEFYIEPVIQYTAAFDRNADSVFTFGIRMGGKAGVQ